MKNIQKLTITSLTCSLLVLGGCASSPMQTSTQMTSSIFLDPVTNSQKTIYLQVKNFSNKKINFKTQLKTDLKQHGYQLINDPARAHYILQIGTLNINESSKHFISLITDVQITDHGKKNVTVIFDKNLKVGTVSQREVNYMKYTTRVFSIAQKSNLDLKVAKTKLENDLAHSISELF